jgi:hypothetical protein
MYFGGHDSRAFVDLDERLGAGKPQEQPQEQVDKQVPPSYTPSIVKEGLCVPGKIRRNKSVGKRARQSYPTIGIESGLHAGNGRG